MGSPVDVVEAYASALRDRDLARLAELIAEDVAGHEPAGEIRGRAAYIRNIEQWFAAYPDLELTTEDLFGDGDRAAWRWTLRGAHAVTGEAQTVAGIIVFRVAGEGVAEYWGHYTVAVSVA